MTPNRGFKGQRGRWLVASCCIWLVTLVLLACGQNAPAVAELSRLAADGDADAQYNLGVSYANGESVSQDRAEAVRWYRLAADQGHADAQYNLGVSYANGEGVSQDYAEAVRWYRLAAEQGLADAQASLGAGYIGGEGVPQDYVTAHMWLNLAAAQGAEEARELRDLLAELMSPEQVDAAQRAAREWRPASR